MAAAGIGRPGGDGVLPVAPEMIGNEAGLREEGANPAGRSYEEPKPD